MKRLTAGELTKGVESRGRPQTPLEPVLSHLVRAWVCAGSGCRFVVGVAPLLKLRLNRGSPLATQRTLHWGDQNRCDSGSGRTTNASQRCPRPNGERRCCPNQQTDPGLVSDIGGRKNQQRKQWRQAGNQQQPLKHAHSRGPCQRFRGARSSSRPSNRRTTRKSTISSKESGRVYQAGMGAAMVAPASARPVRLRR